MVWQRPGFPRPLILLLLSSLCFMLSANQLSLSLVVAEIAAACPAIPTDTYYFQPSRDFEAKFQMQGERPWICLDGDHLIQSAMGARACRTVMPMGNPLRCVAGWERQRQTDRERCPQSKGSTVTCPRSHSGGPGMWTQRCPLQASASSASALISSWIPAHLWSVWGKWTLSSAPFPSLHAGLSLSAPRLWSSGSPHGSENTLLTWVP